MSKHLAEVMITCAVLCTVVLKSFGLEISVQSSRPDWATFSDCVIKVPPQEDGDHPYFATCDPDRCLTYDSVEIGVQRDHIRNCRTKLINNNIDLSQLKVSLLFHVKSLVVDGIAKNQLDEIDEFLERLAEWFNVTQVPSFIVFVKWEQFEVREWFSKPLRDIAEVVPDKEPDRRLAYGAGKDQVDVVSLIYTEMCQVTEKFFKTPFLSIPLWVIFGVIMSVGLFAFGFWVFRFNKAHPTEEGDQDTYGMTEGYLNSNGTVEVPMSDYGFLTSDFSNVEAVSHEPVSSESREKMFQV